MLRFTIRKMMLAVVGLAILCTIIAAFERANARGKQEQCERNLRNVSLGILGYLYNASTFPAGTWPNEGLPADERVSWYGFVSPYLDFPIWNEIDQGQSWNHVGVNNNVATTRIGVCTCPESAQAAAGALQPTTYIGIAGVGIDAPLLPKRDPRAGVFGYDRQTTLADIKDGAANTLLIAETLQVSGSWFQGGPATVRGLDPARKPYVGPGRQFGGLHAGGACVAMADGSVRWVSNSLSAKILEAISTIAGGESVTATW